MVLGRSRRTGVLDEDLLVPTLIGVASGALHPDVGRDPAEDDRSNAPTPELQIEVSAVEGSSLPLAYDVVASPGPELRHDLVPPGRRALPRRRLIDHGTQPVPPILPDRTGEAVPTRKAYVGPLDRSQCSHPSQVPHAPPRRHLDTVLPCPT